MSQDQVINIPETEKETPHTIKVQFEGTGGVRVTIERSRKNGTDPGEVPYMLTEVTLHVGSKKKVFVIFDDDGGDGSVGDIIFVK